jgi:hypothetical protein
MIPPSDPRYRAALARPHEAVSRIEVWYNGIQRDEITWRQPGPYVGGNIVGRRAPVFYSGSVRASLTSRVTRTMDLTVPEAMYPWGTKDLLTPYGTELRAFKGIRFGSGTLVEFPVFVGTVEEVSPPRGTCTVKASDTALRVAGAGFQSPLPSQVGSLLLDEYERLVLDANPRAVFGPHSAITTKVPQLSYDDDRGQALDNLAQAANAFWYTLADGRYVMRLVPWLAPLTQAPLALSDGAGGTILDAFPVRAATGIYNQVTVLSDRADGGPALWASASDDDPASPTYIRGAFGVRSQRIRLTGAVVQAQLDALARATLERSKARTESWQATIVPDASIELGDALALAYRGHLATQYVASFSMPLGKDQTMQLQLRDLVGVDA